MTSYRFFSCGKGIFVKTKKAKKGGADFDHCFIYLATNFSVSVCVFAYLYRMIESWPTATFSINFNAK